MFLLLLTVVIAIYYYHLKYYNYWAKRKVKHDLPLPLFGNHLLNQIGRKSHTLISVEMYNKYPDEKIIGYYKGRNPVLIVKDLDLIKQIMTSDFQYFYKRQSGMNLSLPLLFLNLFHANGDLWKLLRHRLTSAFTIAKLRAMFPLVVRCAERLQNMMENLEGQGDIHDAYELMARFTTEFIGACGFGIEMDSINNEHSQFRELGKNIYKRTLKSVLVSSFCDTFPELRRFIRIGAKKIEKDLTAIVKQILEQRNHKPIGRHDFIDLLLELEARGKITERSMEKVDKHGNPVQVQMEMDLQCQVSQVFIFFAAGFETSSTATSFTLHILAFNQETQKKIQDEIDSVMIKYNNDLCYDAIADMVYLGMAFKEAMRLFPPLGILNRICTRRYQIPGTDITIDPGVHVVIPVQAIHMDEQYYDNPEEFEPERFAPEALKMRHNFAYLPFGAGPRACIGARLGEMQSLAGLATILHKYQVEPAPNTKRELNINHYFNVVQNVKGGLPLLFRPRNKS